MGAPQTKILTDTLGAERVGPAVDVVSNSGAASTKTLGGVVGALAIGKPGDITSRAFGPVVYTGVLAADAEFGTYIDGKGILVNSNDVANLKNFDENFKAHKGQTVGFMTYGTCVVKGSAVADIKAAMNARVVYGEKETYADGDVVDIEVTGFKASAS